MGPHLDRRRFLLGAALLPVAGCASTEDALPPQVSVADVTFLQGGILEQRMRIDLRVGNPNDFDLPLEGLTFKLELNGNALAEGFSNESVRIPRLGEAEVPVTASTTLLDLVRQMLALGQAGDLSYRISGLVYLGGLRRRRVPYERLGRLELLPGTQRDRTLVPI